MKGTRPHIDQVIGSFSPNEITIGKIVRLEDSTEQGVTKRLNSPSGFPNKDFKVLEFERSNFIRKVSF